MEIILLDKINKLGNLGDKVRVRNGYARNYLLPRGMAKPATPENLKEFEARRAELEQRSKDALTAATARKEQLDALGSITIRAKSAGEGKLFGSVGTFDIVEAVVAAGVPLEKSEVRLPEGKLRNIGEYQVVIHLHTDVAAQLQVIIEEE